MTEKIDWFGNFLPPPHYVNSQNTIISFEHVDFWPKIFLILYPSLGNLTTHITIVPVHSEREELSITNWGFAQISLMACQSNNKVWHTNQSSLAVVSVPLCTIAVRLNFHGPTQQTFNYGHATHNGVKHFLKESQKIRKIKGCSFSKYYYISLSLTFSSCKKKFEISLRTFYFFIT